MDDEVLRSALSELYANDSGTPPASGSTSELRSLCRQAIRERLFDDDLDFRVYLSCLILDLYLSDAALESGLGIEDACEFWTWFDQTMWPTAVGTATGASTAG